MYSAPRSKSRGESLRGLLLLSLEILIPVLIFFGVLELMKVTMGTQHPVLVVAIDMPVWYETSMYPVLTAGDVIFMQGVKPDQVAVGDVIAFWRPYGEEDLIIHRVISVTQDQNGILYYRTKGDFNMVEDPYLVPQENVVGRWIGLKVQFVGLLILMAQTGGVRIVLLLALVVMIAISLRDLMRPRDTKKTEAEDTDSSSSMSPAESG